MFKRLGAIVAMLTLAYTTPVFAGEYDQLSRPLQLYIKAQKLLSYQEYKIAIPLFYEVVDTTDDELLKRLASTGILHAHLAAGLSGDKKPEDVIHHMDEALSIQEDLYNAWKYKALAHCDLKQYSECDSAMTTAIQHSPEESKHFHIWVRAMKRADMGRSIPAAQDFKSAIQMAIKYGDKRSAQGFAMSAKAFGINLK